MFANDKMETIANTWQYGLTLTPPLKADNTDNALTPTTQD